ncbi:unnamed protein product [Adineta steineri]|uniref:Uncharacterized protein n=1 Tax=Adineta steineri TaxID=433720 RepID=A0A813NED0_9BILA|nr:unnamed protein product [Adineta steineri]CAF3977913.1 unnamed protein product [Adineta steineri]
MQHELGTESVVMINNPDTAATKPLAHLKDLQLQRCRTVLLIMLGICLGSCLTNIYIEIINYRERSPTNTRIIGISALIALFGFGLFVSYKYSKKGLCVVCNLI